MQADKRNFGLDLIRSLAIFFVVVTHSQRHVRVVDADFRMYTKIDGVTLFFVLSGFLIGQIIFRAIRNEGSSSLIRFYNRRWWRTLPNYYFFFLLHIVFYFLFGIGDNIDWRGLLFLQNLVAPPTGFFRESWSLAVEEWFYLVFPAFWWMWISVFKQSKLRHFAVYTGVMLLLAWIYKAWYFSEYSVEDVEIHARLPVVFRFSSILWGVGLSVLFMYRKSWFQRGWPWLLAALAVWAFGEWFFPQMAPPFKSIWKFEFKSLLAALFIAAAFSLSAPNIRLTQWVTRISVYSYSIYLINLPFLAIWRWLIIDKLGVNNWWGIWSTLLLGWALIFALSSLTYHQLEAPFTRRRMAEKRE